MGGGEGTPHAQRACAGAARASAGETRVGVADAVYRTVRGAMQSFYAVMMSRAIVSSRARTILRTHDYSAVHGGYADG